MSEINGNTKAVSFPRLLEQNKVRLKNLLPEYVAPERYLSLAMLAVNRDARLRQAAADAPETVVDSVLRAAQLGLEIGGAVPGAHLVAFRNGRKNRMECQMIADYRGLISLAIESGAIVSGDARVVYRGEEFRVEYGTDPKIIHIPDFAAIDAGEIVAFYFVARLPNGETKFEIMTKAQVDAIRARSKAANDGPWVTDYAEMGRKTVTKRALKYIPMNPNNAASRKLAMAIEQDNRFESGDIGGFMDFETEEDASRHAAERTAERMADLKQRMGANGRDVTDIARHEKAESAAEDTGDGAGDELAARKAAVIDFVAKLQPGRGDATDAQREGIRERAVRLFGDSEEKEVVFTAADYHRLGKAQAGLIISHLDAALELLQPRML